jgi:hypothetical protein
MMARLECPTRIDVPAYFYRILLEKASYTLSLNFNDRMGKWMISIGDEAGNQIVGNVPVIVNYPIFLRYKDVRLPMGTLWAWDSSNKNEDPGRYDLGDRVRLIYQEAG